MTPLTLVHVLSMACLSCNAEALAIKGALSASAVIYKDEEDVLDLIECTSTSFGSAFRHALIFLFE